MLSQYLDMLPMQVWIHRAAARRRRGSRYRPSNESSIDPSIESPIEPARAKALSALVEVAGGAAPAADLEELDSGQLNRLLVLQLLQKKEKKRRILGLVQVVAGDDTEKEEEISASPGMPGAKGTFMLDRLHRSQRQHGLEFARAMEARATSKSGA